MAIEYYQEAITLEPAHANAMNNLAWIYFEKNHPKALEIASQAYKLSPEDAGILDTYGWILVNQLNQEQRRLGITLLEKAVKKAPENALIKSHLEKARQS